MGTTPEPRLTAGIEMAPSWALPIAVAIPVAGSLAFWSLVGLVWVASRPGAPAARTGMKGKG